MTRRKQRGSRHSATLTLAACLVGLCLVAYFSGISETPTARPDTAGTLPTDTEQQADAAYDELERMASKLGADYKTGLPRPPVERE